MSMDKSVNGTGTKSFPRKKQDNHGLLPVLHGTYSGTYRQLMVASCLVWPLSSLETDMNKLIKGGLFSFFFQNIGYVTYVVSQSAALLGLHDAFGNFFVHGRHVRAGI